MQRRILAPSTPRSFSVQRVVQTAQKGTQNEETRYNFLRSPFGFDADPEQSRYPLVTAKDLAKRLVPPKRVKMLARDFIDDCLYNPNYGYFSSQAYIFDPDETHDRYDSQGHISRGKPSQGKTQGNSARPGRNRRSKGLDFRSFPSTNAFEDEVARRYGELESGNIGQGINRQVWHTPTELFKPWYGRALARYIVSQYKLSLYPYEDLIIYEIGAGNGTLMGDILDYIAEEEPAVYARTRYRIVEISERLQALQKDRAQLSDVDSKAARKGRRSHASKVEIIGGGIFEWRRVVPEPCFFIAMEVLDNFSHDIVRYSTADKTPYQCLVSVDATGDYREVYEPVTDPLIARYLALRAQTPTSKTLGPHNFFDYVLDTVPRARSLYAALPLVPNLSRPDFLPTKQLMLLDVLREYFPAHRILFSDFSSLPDAIDGATAPVVQTRYQGETVACSTYLVQPGYFDVFFPTNFELLRDLYNLVMPTDSAAALEHAASSSPRLASDFFSPHAKRVSVPKENSSLSALLALSSPSSAPSLSNSPSNGGLQVLTHREFLERWGEVDMTQCRDKSNPMLESYLNAKFIF